MEHGGNIDVALNLAQTAKEQAPEDPRISDTLGWIYFKKDVSTRAVIYLEESKEKLPYHPVVRYHLGMAYLKNGQIELAEKELGKALELDPNFEGAEEARKALEEMRKGA